jgi:glyoxylase-like metal-dependent hydrolase (beta-lactamase superfamily II)
VPLFATNPSEAEPVIQVTNNPLVVDTGQERVLADTGFGEKIGPSFDSFPGLEANLRRAGITPESIDLVVISHGHLDHIGGLVTKSGALAFPNAQFVFVDMEWNYWTGSRACRRGLPLSAEVLRYVAGWPFMRKVAPGTGTLTRKAEPVPTWQSVQWHPMTTFWWTRFLECRDSPATGFSFSRLNAYSPIPLSFRAS